MRRRSVAPGRKEVAAAPVGAALRVRPLDVVTVLNLGLFGFACATKFWDRWLQYRGPGNFAEFLIYAAVIAAGFVVFWYGLRDGPWTWGFVALVEAPALLHFAGVLVPVDGARLYDWVVLGIRFDKVVHLASAAAVAIALRRILRWFNVQLGVLEPLAILLIVMGLGAFWEIVEYIVMRTIPGAGVGLYDNNLQDMIANMLGGGTAVLLDRVPLSRVPK